MTPAERFFRNTYPEPNTGCWLWGRSCRVFGHGQLNGKFNNGFQSAHRYSYFLHNGDFDRTMQVLHKCDVPCCVNPDHLFLGTNLDNRIDAVRKNRHQKGSRNKLAKLSEADIPVIRSMRLYGVSNVNIAKRFGVDPSAISHVLRGYSWKHVQ